MYTDCQEFQKEGSGWAVNEVLHLRLLTGKYKPLKGSQYFELPKKIAKTGCILNIQNKDDKDYKRGMGSRWCSQGQNHKWTVKEL